MDTRDAYLGLRVFVDELVRCGLREACTSPGSRSAPLVLSLVADRRLRSSSHIDERSGGFYALGLAKATGVPVALACTSGTAAANYLPAVIEAREARVPLLVLTADRPPELRDVGAGQAIDQLKLYGTAVKWFQDVDEHDATQARLRWMRQLACRAFWTALDGRPGPVHLNFAFREPLVLDVPLPEDDAVIGRQGGRPWTTRPRPQGAPADALISGLEAELRNRPHAILVAGRSERDPGLGEVLADFAARAAIPLLAEPLSGARRGPAAVAHYDALLRDPEWAAAHEPELVVRLGDLPTSGPLRRWLGGLDSALQVAFDPEAAWQDPAAAVGTILAADPRTTLEALAPSLHGRATEWLDSWRGADRAAAGAIAGVLGPDLQLTEPRVAAEIGGRLPAEATVVVASSMPVRDVETFFPVRADPPRVLSSRGANGIDGTLSTALGAAAGVAGPCVLLTGDVAFLHDLGGLLAVRRLGARLTIVLLDNDGGGIFHFLPVRDADGDAFETHVATPHGIDFADAAALFGCRYERAASPVAFRDALDRALVAGTTTIIAVRSDRDGNVALHRRVWQAVAEAVSPRGSGAVRRA